MIVSIYATSSNLKLTRYDKIKYFSSLLISCCQAGSGLITFHVLFDLFDIVCMAELGLHSELLKKKNYFNR